MQTAPARSCCRGFLPISVWDCPPRLDPPLRILDKEFQIISELKSPKQSWEIPVEGTVPIFSASILKPGSSALLCLHAAFLFKDFINAAKLILITVIIQLY